MSYDSVRGARGQITTTPLRKIKNVDILARNSVVDPPWKLMSSGSHRGWKRREVAPCRRDRRSTQTVSTKIWRASL